jgi:hypothetical protein
LPCGLGYWSFTRAGAILFQKGSGGHAEGGDEMKMPKNIGKIVMAAWFILFGILYNSFFDVHFAHSVDVLAVLAVIVGVLLFLYPQ